MAIFKVIDTAPLMAKLTIKHAASQLLNQLFQNKSKAN